MAVTAVSAVPRHSTECNQDVRCQPFRHTQFDTVGDSVFVAIVECIAIWLEDPERFALCNCLAESISLSVSHACEYAVADVLAGVYILINSDTGRNGILDRFSVTIPDSNPFSTKHL